jgi:hypothetical protein
MDGTDASDDKRTASLCIKSPHHTGWARILTFVAAGFYIHPCSFSSAGGQFAEAGAARRENW